MDQAKATTPTSSTQDRDLPAPGSFEHATVVAASVIGRLVLTPFAVEISEDFPSGWRVHLKYRDVRAAGLLEFASTIDVPVTKVATAFGVHFDCIARHEGLELHASALTSEAQAAELEGLAAPAAEPAQPAVVPVPLGSSVVASVPVITAVVPVATEPAVAEDDVARCVRCGCTEAAACEGGCYWVPNRQLIDLCSACATVEELAAVTYTAEASDGGDQ